MIISAYVANDKSVEVQTTSTLVVPPNAYRRWLVFVVQGATGIWLRLGATAVADAGIWLVDSGGAIIIDMATMPWYGEVNAIAQTAASKLTCQEIEVYH